MGIINENQITEILFGDRELVIYGCGKRGENIIHRLDNKGIIVSECVDSSVAKQGTLFQDRFVIQPPSILKDNVKKYCVMVCGDCSIYSFLEECGYSRNVDYMDSLEFELHYFYQMVRYIKEKSFKTLFAFAPSLGRILNLTANEKAIKNMKNVIEFNRIEWLQSAAPHVRECYRGMTGDLDGYIKNIFTGSEVVKRNGAFFQSEMRSKYVNVTNGMRVTTDQPFIKNDGGGYAMYLDLLIYMVLEWRTNIQFLLVCSVS